MLFESEIARDCSCFRLSRVAAKNVEPLFGIRILAHCILVGLLVDARHVFAGPFHLGHQVAKAASIQDACSRELLRVAAAWILRQVTNLA